ASPAAGRGASTSSFPAASHRRMVCVVRRNPRAARRHARGRRRPPRARGRAEILACAGLHGSARSSGAWRWLRRTWPPAPRILPDRAADIVADLGVDAAALAGLVKCLEARGTAPVVFSKHKPLQRTRLRDHAGPTDVGPDIGDAAHERLVAEDRPQHIVLLHAVLKRDDAGAGLRDRQQLARSTLSVPELDAEHYDIDGADGAGVVGHVDFGQMERLRPAFDRETVLAHGG